MEPTTSEFPKNTSQRPFGVYFSKPIVHWNRCNFKRKEMITQIQGRNVDSQLHCNYRDSSDDDSNESAHCKTNSKYTVTSMGVKLNVGKEIEYDESKCVYEGVVHGNNLKYSIDDVPLFALVNTEDTPNKNESRNYNNTNINNNIL